MFNTPTYLGQLKLAVSCHRYQLQKYCYHHAPRVSAGIFFLREKEINVESSGAQPASTPPCEGVVWFIIGKKATRGQVYYQVFTLLDCVPC